MNSTESPNNSKVGYWNETIQKINYLVSFQSPIREGKEKTQYNSNLRLILYLYERKQETISKETTSSSGYTVSTKLTFFTLLIFFKRFLCGTATMVLCF